MKRELLMEVAPGLYQMRLPLRNNPLGSINCYLVQGKEGWLLVDTGWDTADAFESLESQLRELSLQISDISQIVVTHGHIDHMGLSGRLQQLSGCRLAIHELDSVLLLPRRKEEWCMADWMRNNGVPDSELDSLGMAPSSMLSYVTPARPDLLFRGGESITIGGFQFQVLWTPGHSSGHICLYEPSKRLLLAGDLVLSTITPNISLHALSRSNPLGDYFDSLRKVGQLEVNMVLPGHGNVFHNLKERIDEIIHHHQERLGQMGKLLEGGPKTAYEVASGIPWLSPPILFGELEALPKRLAVMESLAHLELLRANGKVARLSREAITCYGLPVKPIG